MPKKKTTVERGIFSVPSNAYTFTLYVTLKLVWITAKMYKIGNCDLVFVFLILFVKNTSC